MLDGLKLLLVALLLVPSAALATPRVGVAGPLLKVRPSTPAPQAAEAVVEAARNEFEPFQVVVQAGSTAVSGVSASTSDLVGPGGARIAARHAALYRVGLHTVRTPSNLEGASGRWPDPLIPDVDTYVGEKRSAFPFDVPAGESRAIWVDLYVPAGTAPGAYQGTVTITGSGFSPIQVPVRLTVFPFELPSRSTLKSSYGMGWADACIAHFGSTSGCGSDSASDAMRVLYGRAGLDHRISIEDVVDRHPGWGEFDRVFGPLLDGTAPTRLPGASLTVMQLKAKDATAAASWRDHFASRGWLDVLFDYTCDEPPAGCSFSSIADRAVKAQSVGIPTLVTTSIAKVQQYGLTRPIDILTPVINHVHDKRDGLNRRADYDSFLTGKKEMWWYQSCMSHGCASGCSTNSDAYFTGWPSYMIDASAIQNRAMEWLSFSYRVSGELYFSVSSKLASAWDDQCAFGGNGDGTLFYPGTPKHIGGSTHIPVESIRLKLIREGMEDYEYLHLLATLGGEATARDEARSLFPNPYTVTSATPEKLMATRARLARGIVDRLPQPEPDPEPGEGGAGGHDLPPIPGVKGDVRVTPRLGCAAAPGGAALAGIGLVLALLVLRRRGG